MSQVTHVGGLSSFTYVGMAGLSVASVIGIAKLWKHLFYPDLRRAKDDEISKLRHSLSAARLDAQTKDEDITKLKKDLAGMGSKLEELGRLLQTTKGQNQVLGDQVKAHTREALSLKDEIAQAKIRHAQTLELLDARTLELKGAEAFLTKADSLSGADVITMLNTLNSEIYQTAALVAESFEFTRKKGGVEGVSGAVTGGGEQPADMEEVYASATEILGSRMVELLKSSEHHEDPTLIQIAFQAGMSAYSNWIVSSWYFEDPEDALLLSEIYARVREAEEQAVSGRWRALTRAHAQRMSDHEPDLAMYFLDAFANILLTAGVNKSHAALQGEVESRFGDRVAVIVKGAQRLRKAIGEEITSCDFEILHTAIDAPFDPSRMDDAFAGDYAKGRDDPELILCTTDLGLARFARIAGKVGEWDEAVLLRPKVVLRSGIEEMMAEDTA